MRHKTTSRSKGSCPHVPAIDAHAHAHTHAYTHAHTQLTHAQAMVVAATKGKEGMK